MELNVLYLSFISFELIFTTILLIFIWSFYNLGLASIWFTALRCIINLNLVVVHNWLIGIILLWCSPLFCLFNFRLQWIFPSYVLFNFSIDCCFLFRPFFSSFNLTFYFIDQTINTTFFTKTNQWSIYLLFLFNLIFNVFFFVSILAESNRVPFDLLEAESELVAGFITEYSSIYFTLILLTEYGSIINMSFWMIILFSIIIWFLILLIEIY